MQVLLPLLLGPLSTIRPESAWDSHNPVPDFRLTFLLLHFAFACVLPPSPNTSRARSFLTWRNATFALHGLLSSAVAESSLPSCSVFFFLTHCSSVSYGSGHARHMPRHLCWCMAVGWVQGGGKFCTGIFPQGKIPHGENSAPVPKNQGKIPHLPNLQCIRSKRDPGIAIPKRHTLQQSNHQ